MERLIVTKSTPTFYADSIRSVVYAKIARGGAKGVKSEPLVALEGGLGAIRYLLKRKYVKSV